MKLKKLFLFIALIAMFGLVLSGCILTAPEAPEVQEPSEEPAAPAEPAEPGEAVGDDEREFVDWETMENGAMFLAMLVPKADEAIEKGLATELQADYILHNAIALGTWPRGSSPGYSDVIYAPATYGYDKVPENWDGPKYISAPRP